MAAEWAEEEGGRMVWDSVGMSPLNIRGYGCQMSLSRYGLSRYCMGQRARRDSPSPRRITCSRFGTEPMALTNNCLLFVARIPRVYSTHNLSK